MNDAAESMFKHHVPAERSNPHPTGAIGLLADILHGYSPVIRCVRQRVAREYRSLEFLADAPPNMTGSQR